MRAAIVGRSMVIMLAMAVRVGNNRSARMAAAGDDCLSLSHGVPVLMALELARCRTPDAISRF